MLILPDKLLILPQRLMRTQCLCPAAERKHTTPQEQNQDDGVSVHILYMATLCRMVRHFITVLHLALNKGRVANNLCKIPHVNCKTQENKQTRKSHRGNQQPMVFVSRKSKLLRYCDSLTTFANRCEFYWGSWWAVYHRVALLHSNYSRVFS